MDLMTFIRQSYNEVYDRIVASCQGLTQEELMWRPAPHTNPIAFILWHAARAEDRMIRDAAQTPEVWITQRWYEKFGHPKEMADVVEDAHQRDTLTLPSLEVLLGYLEAVHKNTLECLKRISPTDFNRVPDPGRPDRTIGSRIRHVTVHGSNHHGQIDYLRGLMRQGWGLPPGTGLKQD